MRHTVLALLAAAALPVAAQTTPAPVNAEQVVVPQVDRREVRLPRFPSRDFSVGAFIGTYGTQNFGSSAVAGVRLGYAVTEDVFVEATLASTRVSDENYRQVLPGGVFAQPKETLSYYNLSAGYNLLPGEIFLGSKIAKASQVYVIGGVGSTKFNDQKQQTFNLGLGMKVYLWERVALQVDLRDHIFSLDLLGKRDSTQNLELTTGFSWFF